MILVGVKIAEFVTAKEAAEVLRCSTQTVYRLIADGVLPAIRMGGPRGHFRIQVCDLRDYCGTL